MLLLYNKPHCEHWFRDQRVHLIYIDLLKTKIYQDYTSKMNNICVSRKN